VLGARLGAASLLLYLAMGATGLPVFTPYGVPGVARLIGPTGGYLLAYPVAAFAAGALAGDARSWWRLAGAMFVGLALIHLGGAAQLLLLTGDAGNAVRLGTLPFLVGDIGKLAVAVLVVRSLHRPVRTRL
jgi:biotin transport system substrate-specific component